MARKSPWLEFAENFEAVYGTFKKIGQDSETARITGKQFTEEGGLGWDAKAGKALEGDALERARYKALGDIYTKYGDADKGLAIRQQLMNLEETRRANDISAATLEHNIDQLGFLKSQAMKTDIGLKESQIQLNQENANKIKKMLGPQFDLAVQQARLAGFTADEAGVNAMLAQDTADTTLEEKLITLKANIREKQALINAADGEVSLEQEIMANRQSIIEKAKQDKITTDNLDAEKKAGIANIDSGTDLNAANAAGQELANDATRLAADIAKQETDFLTQISSEEFWADQGIENPTDAQRTEALINFYKNSNIPIERQIAVETALNTHGISKLQNTALETAQTAKNIMQKEGLDGLIKWYDGVDDGDATSLSLKETADGFALIKTTGTGENAQEQILYQGADKSQIEAKLMGQITNPGAGMEIAASILDMEKVKSEINKDKFYMTLDGKKFEVSARSAEWNDKLTKANIDLSAIRGNVAEGNLSLSEKRFALEDAKFEFSKYTEEKRLELEKIRTEIAQQGADAATLNAEVNAEQSVNQRLLSIAKEKLTTAQIEQVNATTEKIKAQTTGLSNTGLTLKEVSEAFLELKVSDVYIISDAEKQKAMETAFWSSFPNLIVSQNTLEDLPGIESVTKVN